MSMKNISRSIYKRQFHKMFNPLILRIALLIRRERISLETEGLASNGPWNKFFCLKTVKEIKSRKAPSLIVT